MVAENRSPEVRGFKSLMIGDLRFRVQIAMAPYHSVWGTKPVVLSVILSLSPLHIWSNLHPGHCLPLLSFFSLSVPYVSMCFGAATALLLAIFLANLLMCSSPLHMLSLPHSCYLSCLLALSLSLSLFLSCFCSLSLSLSISRFLSLLLSLCLCLLCL